jgi:hypothetical protein
MTMTGGDNDNSIADGVPMNLKQMREYLQERIGAPVALRELAREGGYHMPLVFRETRVLCTTGMGANALRG